MSRDTKPAIRIQRAPLNGPYTLNYASIYIVLFSRTPHRSSFFPLYTYSDKIFDNPADNRARGDLRGVICMRRPGHGGCDGRKEKRGVIIHTFSRPPDGEKRARLWVKVCI